MCVCTLVSPTCAAFVVDELDARTSSMLDVSSSLQVVVRCPKNGSANNAK